MGRDTHQLCVHCLGVQHAQAALEGAACADYEALLIRVLRPRQAVFDEVQVLGSGPRRMRRLRT